MFPTRLYGALPRAFATALFLFAILVLAFSAHAEGRHTARFRHYHHAVRHECRTAARCTIQTAVPALKQEAWINVFGRTIRQVRSFPNKPILLSETAVGPKANQLANINNLFAGVAKYKTLGLVWFDLASDKGKYNQDWRIEGNLPAENAFSLGAASMRLVKP